MGVARLVASFMGASAALLIATLVICSYAAPSTTVVLQGAGATFPEPQLLLWIRMFMETHPTVVISYRGVGSGAGQSMFFAHTIDFCGSDPPLTHEQWAKHRGEVMQIPYLLGAVVVIYNVPGLHGRLNLSGRVLALIYSGKILYWDDPRIQKLNPGAKLPHRRIVVVYRADASGTQYIFTLFLHKAAPDVWPWSLVSKAPKYPVMGSGRAVGGEGNPGVAQIVTSTPYSIGFVEWGYALEKHLRVAAIENACGRFVLPSVESIEAAAREAVKHLPKDPRDDFSTDLQLIVYSHSCSAYPIASWTHLVLWTRYPEPKARALASFLTWIAIDGYRHLVPGYAPMPLEGRELLLKAVRILEGESHG